MLPRNAYTAAEMRTFVTQTPFHECRIDETDDGIGFEVWMAKR
jgi:hypothetical protein